MEKMIYHDRAPILLHPEPANTWHWHAAPEWETACMDYSPWAEKEIRDIAWIRESHGREIAFRLGLIDSYIVQPGRRIVYYPPGEKETLHGTVIPFIGHPEPGMVRIKIDNGSIVNCRIEETYLLP